MKPAPFDYLSARSLEAALEALARAGEEGKILAGGQSLLPMLNFRLLKPSLLIDINRVPGLAGVTVGDGRIRIGALTRHYALETSPLIKAHVPVLADAMAHVGHLAVRNRGTIGGSLAHADPAAELPMLTVLCDANLTIRSPRGTRTIPARGFFTGALTTELAHDEILTEVEVAPFAPGTGWAFAEVARRSGDFALAAMGVTMAVRAGKAASASIAMTGVAEKPLRATAAEDLLMGRAVDAALIDAAAAAIAAAARPNNDLHASADYRCFLLGALARQTITTAWRRARGEPL